MVLVGEKSRYVKREEREAEMKEKREKREKQSRVRGEIKAREFQYKLLYL